MASVTVSQGSARRIGIVAALLFLGVAHYVAVLGSLVIHELFGHGGVGVLLGAHLHAFFLMPVGGFVVLSTPNDLPRLAETAIVAAGPLSTALAGAVGWVAMRAARDVLIRAVLFQFTFVNLLGAIIYGGVQPLLELPAGTVQGDGTRVFASLGLPVALTALIATGLGVWLVAAALRESQRLVAGLLLPGRLVDPFLALCLVLGPGAAAVGAYLVAWWGWLDDFYRISAAFIYVTVLVYALVAWVVLRWRRGALSPPMPSGAGPGRLFAVSAGGVLVAIGVAALFGPVPPLAHGVAVQPVRPEAFFNVRMESEVRLELSAGEEPRLNLRLRPVALSTSPLCVWLADGALREGPTLAAATAALDHAAVQLLGQPADGPASVGRLDDVWLLGSRLSRPLGPKFDVALGRLGFGIPARIEIAGPDVAAGAIPAGTRLESTPGRLVWIVESAASLPVRLEVRWRGPA